MAKTWNRNCACQQPPLLDSIDCVGEHGLLMDEPREKKLRISSFAIHAARGLIRNQKTRRNTMFVTLGVSMLLLFVGSTILQPILREHPGWFILYWFAVAWLTLTAILLALFDMLIVRAQERAAQKAAREQFAARASSDLPSAKHEK